MTERLKAWQCIGCGRLESDATCVGICQDRPVVVVSAADYDQARREVEELRLFIRQLALVSPRGATWEANYQVLRQRARELLERLEPLNGRSREGGNPCSSKTNPAPAQFAKCAG
jgi:hypothetical protein